MSSFRVGIIALSALTTLFQANVVCAQAASAQAQPRAEPKPKPVPARPTLSDAAELQRVIALWDVGKYKECADALGELLKPESARPFRDPEVIENARVYYAACLIGSGQPELADEPLRAAILANPQLRPDSLVFPPAVIERFLRVRETLIHEIRKREEERTERARELAREREEKSRAEQARVRELEQLASTETLVVQNRRWMAAIPFGVGQFQNGDRSLGYVFLTAEAALGITALTALVARTRVTDEAISAQSRIDPEAVNESRQTWHTVFEYSTYGFFAFAVGGIIEAQLSFVPEVRRTVPRNLPEHLRRQSETKPIELKPQANLTPYGFDIGFTGRF